MVCSVSCGHVPFEIVRTYREALHRLGDLDRLDAVVFGANGDQVEGEPVLLRKAAVVEALEGATTL